MLICLTASHKNADFPLLEALSASAGRISANLESAEIPSLRGFVLVATCNRFEAYVDAAGSQPHTIDAVASAITELIASECGPQQPRPTLSRLTGNLVARHLFAVSSGLESVVVGEGEIAGQVRRSLEHARERGTTSPHLERLFQRASHTSRGVKNSTGIGGEGRSLVRLALELAETRVSDWAETRVLLVGTGRYAGASLAALRERGVVDVRVYSASGRAAKFATSHGIRAADAGSLALEAASADIVVTCTTSELPVLDAHTLTAARIGEKRRVIIDLGLPRNVNPDVADLPCVELLDLETIRLHAPLEEFSADAEAQAIVGLAANRFAVVTEEKSIAPAVVALRKHVYDALDAEIERARKRGDDGATEAALRHLAGVLLHTPMVRARELARAGEQDAFVAALKSVFDIEVESDAAEEHTEHLEVS